MRATIAIVSLVVLIAAALAFSTAQQTVPNGGLEDPEPTGTSQPSGTGGPPPSPPPEGYLEADAGRVSPTRDLEYDWQSVEIRATITGVHFNINQDAKRQDSSADTWTQVFHLNAPFRDEDYVSFCGPQTTITIQVRDRNYAQTIHEGTLTQVPPCN